ncbi:MAG TPA: hypothetical protein VM103_00495 [Candidatus Paceibacterota bacterium]|nr:hypothetical protein [Candidatus Paceibacterota bacterium]
MNSSLPSFSGTRSALPAPNASQWVYHDLPEHERLAHLRYHIQTGDYFAVLATVFGFIEEALEEAPHKEDAALSPRLMRSIRKDLQFAGAHCRIVPKNPA